MVDSCFWLFDTRKFQPLQSEKVSNLSFGIAFLSGPALTLTTRGVADKLWNFD